MGTLRDLQNTKLLIGALSADLRIEKRRRQALSGFESRQGFDTVLDLVEGLHLE